MNLDFLTGLVIGAAAGLVISFSIVVAIVKLYEARQRKQYLKRNQTKGKHEK